LNQCSIVALDSAHDKMAIKSTFLLSFLSLLSFASSVLAAFGYTKSGNNYVIDAGSSNSLVFSVSSSSCDINSIKFRGTELQYSGTGTQISSGLGSATVSVAKLSGSSNYIKVTCVTSTLTHYMVVKEGDSTIYLADYITAEPSIGELRFIARLLPSQLPNEYPYGSASTTNGGTAIEASDVYMVNGQTRSKFYSSTRFIDENVHCVYGGSDVIHVCIMTPQQESSSGGPFFRDIDSNNAGASTNLYNYMNSGHVQTEPIRTGLHGPYVMQFSRDGIPSVKNTDMSWFGELGVTGYVPASGRGTVKGTASGVGSQFQPVVHWYNSAAQYWTVASSSGSFTSPLMKPGTYTMVLYQTEFKVATSSVTVSAGRTTTVNIASTFSTAHNTLWKIGEYDGQPTGFRNADKFLRMHPSDSRMSSWGPLTYNVGSSSLNDFPMAVFKSVNDPVTIKFTLSSASGAATLRIATTLSFAGARPQAKVNSWSAPAPGAPTKIDSRGVTRGAYRGNGEVYDVSIPSGTLVKGTNTITISSLSGSDGDKFLSPNFVSQTQRLPQHFARLLINIQIFDCVELFTK
jgi:rhamnogalacturonan endolyase